MSFVKSGGVCEWRLDMTDIVERLRTVGVMDANSCPQCGAPDTDQTDWLMCEAADEIEALRKDLDQLDRLMSDIAMAWVRVPHPPRGQMPSALDMAISRAADFTTGLHRIKKEKDNG